MSIFLMCYLEKVRYPDPHLDKKNVFLSVKTATNAHVLPGF